MGTKRKKLITQTLGAGFVLLFTFLAAGGFFFLNEIKTLSRLTSSIFHHPLVVSNTSLQCSLTITKMHRTMKDIVLISDPGLIQNEILEINTLEKKVFENLDTIHENILGDQGKALETEARVLFQAWKPIRDSVITLVLEKKTARAARITRTTGAGHVNKMEAKMQELTDYARTRASEFLEQSDQTGKTIRSLSIVFLAGALILLFIAGILVISFAMRYEEDLVQSEHRHRIIFENSPLGMIRFSPDGTIIDLNDQFVSLMGSSREKLLGFNTATQSSPAMQKAIKKALAGKTAVFEDTYTSVTGGKTIYLRAVFSPVSPGREQTEVIATLEDITDRKAADAAIQENEQRLDTIFNAVQTGIFIVDKETRTLVDINAAAEIMVGRPKEQMIGRLCHEFVCTAGQHACPILDRGQAIDNSERVLLTADKQTLPILKTVTQVSIQGRPCLLECFVDISHQKKIEEGLREAKEAAESATRAKADFLANMSHEIRTPMNGVIGMTDLLESTGLDEEQKDYVSAIKTSGQALLSIINDILDHSKIDAGKVELESIPFNPRTLLEDIGDLMAVRAQEKGLEYCTIIPPQIPACLEGDPGRLRQILVNLIGNAVKFTHEGEILVEARVEDETKDRVELRFIVTDTGIGIPDDKIDILFTPFSQADTSTTRQYGGTGLGLTISRQLTLLMNGRIDVRSKAGQGTCFEFTIPLKKSSSDETTPFLPRQSIRDKYILVVDDNKTNRQILTGELKHWGCRYKEAGDGRSGLDMMRAAADAGTPFDMAIIDMQMPEMDGAQLGQEIKADPGISQTLLIMLTSTGMRGDTKRFKKIGFSAYLNKPVKQQDLFECLSTVHHARPAPESETPATIITRHSIAENNPERKRILLAEDNRINQKVALSSLKKLGFSADVVINGKEAVNTLTREDYDLVFMDCQMPDMDGYQATRAIREGLGNVLNQKVPIIAMTANAMEGDRERCLDAGMNDYLPKPVKIKGLSEMLKKWLG